MPGLTQKNDHLNGGSSAVYSLSANGFWSQHRDDVSYVQLQKVFISFVARRFNSSFRFIIFFIGIIGTRLDHFPALYFFPNYTS